jgi:hypothetical protein
MLRIKQETASEHSGGYGIVSGFDGPGQTSADRIVLGYSDHRQYRHRFNSNNGIKVIRVRVDPFTSSYVKASNYALVAPPLIPAPASPPPMAAPGFFDFVTSFGKIRPEREDFSEKLEAYHKAIKEIQFMRTVNAGDDERKPTTANLKHDNASRTEGKPLARFDSGHEIDELWDTVGCHFHGSSTALNLSDLHLKDSKAKGLKPKLDEWITNCTDITGPKDLLVAPGDDKISDILSAIFEFYKDSWNKYMDYIRSSYMDCVPLVAKTSEGLWNLRGKFQNIPRIIGFLHLDGEDFHTASEDFHTASEDFHKASAGENGNKALHSSSHRNGMHLRNFVVYDPRNKTPQEIEPFEDGNNHKTMLQKPETFYHRVLHDEYNFPVVYISQKELNTGINCWVKRAAGILKRLGSLLRRNLGEQSGYGSRHGFLKTTRIIGSMSL